MVLILQWLFHCTLFEHGGDRDDQSRKKTHDDSLEGT